MTPQHRPRSVGLHAGFTLIEVVVALSILALALGVLYEGFGWSLRRTNTLRQQEAAWLTAQSLISEVRGQSAIRVGAESGDTASGLQWRRTVVLHDGLSEEPSWMKAFDVTVDVRWGARDGQQIRLQTVELGREAS